MKSLVRFQIWERGNTGVPELMESLLQSLRHATCDLVLEYRLLTAPVCEPPQTISVPTPTQSAPPTPRLPQGELHTHTGVWTCANYKCAYTHTVRITHTMPHCELYTHADAYTSLVCEPLQTISIPTPLSSIDSKENFILTGKIKVDLLLYSVINCCQWPICLSLWYSSHVIVQKLFLNCIHCSWCLEAMVFAKLKFILFF